MLFHFSLRGFLLFVIFGCGAPPQLFREDHDPTAPQRLIYHIEVDAKGVKQGRETWWYDNGVKKYEGMNDAGVRSGVFRAWYPSGKLWYQGMEVHGVPQDSLIYWYPNGRVESVTLFRQGVQIHHEAFDSVIVPPPPPIDTVALKRQRDSLQVELRKQGVARWADLLRATVEPQWILPRRLLKRPNRAVVLLRIGRTGDLRGIDWVSRSPSSDFNNLAAKALKKIKRYPAFPLTVPDTVLEIQYEFMTPGKVSQGHKLILKGSPASASGSALPPS